MGATEAPSTGATWKLQEHGFTNGQATGDAAGHVLVWMEGARALEHRMSFEPLFAALLLVLSFQYQLTSCQRIGVSAG